MRAIVVLLLLLPLRGFAEEVRLDLEAPWDANYAALQKLGAKDISATQEILGPHGERAEGLIWSVSDFKLILETAHGLNSLSYWTWEDYGRSKISQVNNQHYVRSIVFDTDKKTFVVTLPKRKPWWTFW